MPDSPLPDGTPRLAIDWDVAEEFEERLDRAFAERILEEALEARNPSGMLAIGLTVTTDDRIRDLNARFRGVDSATDVLSFPMLDYEHPERPSAVFPSPPGEPLALGDIVVSFPRVLKQAVAYGHSAERELGFLLVHGALHLLGYDHENPDDQAAMRKEEEGILERLGLRRQG